MQGPVVSPKWVAGGHAEDGVPASLGAYAPARQWAETTLAEKRASVATSLNMVRVMAMAAARQVSENTTASRLALRICSDSDTLSSAGRNCGETSPSLFSHTWPFATPGHLQWFNPSIAVLPPG